MKLTERLIYIAVIIFLIICLRECKGKSQTITPEVKSEKTDTTQSPIKDTSTNDHEPVLVLEGGKIPDKKQPVDSFIAFDPIPVDTNKILQPIIEKYNVLQEQYTKLLQDRSLTREYTDTNHFAQGDVVVNNRVKDNRLNLQSVSLLNFKETIITKTITLAPAKRAQFYFGLGAQYNIGDSSFAAGPSLLFKTRRDHIYSIHGMVNTQKQFSIQASTFWKLSFKKQ